MDDDTIDRRVRLSIFDHTAATGSVPTTEAIASTLGVSLDAIDASLQRLAAGRVIVLAPGTLNIWMANPFSAVPTDFRVEARGRTYFGNCIWDGLGVLAVLNADGAVRTHCPDCGESLVLSISGGRIARDTGIIHFVVPAIRWWDNIGFT